MTHGESTKRKWMRTDQKGKVKKMNENRSKRKG